MPDGDVIARTVRPRWRKNARLATSGATAAAVGDAATKALADRLRKSGGCPELAGLASALWREAATDAQGAFDKAGEAARSAAVGSRRLRDVQAAIEAAEAVAAKGLHPGSTEEHVLQLVAEAFLERIVVLIFLARSLHI